MLLKQLSSSHSITMIEHTDLWLGRESHDPSPFPNGTEGSSFPGLFPPDDTVRKEWIGQGSNLHLTHLNFIFIYPIKQLRI